MVDRVVMVWEDAYLAYDFGPGHPLNPLRLELTMKLSTALELLSLDHVQVVPGRLASEDELLRIHDKDYVEAVKQPLESYGNHGLGEEDNPLFPDMHMISARVAGGSIVAVENVLNGAASHALNIAGGLHHAMRDRASGFCIYNDPAIAIMWALDHGVERVAYIDVDVHHGDGVQAAFYDDPRVLTISLHQTPISLFPGTGFPDEVGGPHAEGKAVNVALPPQTSDSGWLRAFNAVVPELVFEFRPQLLVTQCGCDTHHADPLADMNLTVDGQRLIYTALHALAHEVCAGRWVALGGGGYNLAGCVPLAWTHLLAIAAERPLDPSTAIPTSWVADTRRLRLPGVVPTSLTETQGISPTWSSWQQHDNATPLDRAIAETRRAVFPLYGLSASGA